MVRGKSPAGTEQSIPAEKSAKRHGFSLIETAVAVFLMAIIFIGTMNLFLTTGRTTQKVSAATAATTDAANASQYVVESIREAYKVTLPGETNGDCPWPTPATYPPGDYTVNDDGAIIYTGIVVTHPAIVDSVSVSGNGGQISLNTAQSRLYDRTNKGRSVLIYRGDDAGNPAPSDGGSLWERDLSSPGSAPRQILSDVASAPGAVHFERRNSNPALIHLKIVSGQWSYTIGEQTSETTSGEKVTALTTRAVQLRNAAIAGTTIPEAPPVVIPTPRPRPTPTPRPRATPTPRPRSTPTPRPRSTPTPRPRSTPTPRPRPTPTPIPPGGLTWRAGGDTGPYQV
jgi:type II secretory pathway pseudopilin PulG